MYETGFGDCGTQSMLFSALCRSTGIPARAAGGYQLAPGLAGTHFWAEFYLPAYGWIPVDVTIAESSDWSWNATDAERDTFKGYYFGNLDPYRLTMQNDVDVPFSPKPGEDAILNMVHQTPTVVCEGVNEDLELLGMEYWTITLSDVS
jgi:transglutaminase-like putative cysteine protease